MKKRYWLFGIVHYESIGGMGDFIEDFDSIEMLEESNAFKKILKNSYHDAEVYDT